MSPIVLKCLACQRRMVSPSTIGSNTSLTIGELQSGEPVPVGGGGGGGSFFPGISTSPAIAGTVKMTARSRLADILFSM
jgi:hypothetical protein